MIIPYLKVFCQLHRRLANFTTTSSEPFSNSSNFSGVILLGREMAKTPSSTSYRHQNAASAVQGLSERALTFFGQQPIYDTFEALG